MKYHYTHLINSLAKLPLLVFFIFCLPGVSAGQSNSLPGAFKTASYNGRQLLIRTGNGYISIIPYSANIIKVTYQQQPVENVKSYSTIAQPQPVKAMYKEGRHFVQLTTPGLRIAVNKADLAVYFISKKGDTLSSALNYGVDGNGFKLDFILNNTEAVYGGGSRAINLNKRGQVLENYNQAHGGYKFGAVDLNIAIPFLVSSRHYGLYVDNFSKSRFDVAKAGVNKVTFTATSGAACFYFVGGKSMDEVMANYTSLTGRQPLPPRWAMGYISSRYGYKSEKEIMSVVDKTQQENIPLDAVVFDLYWYKSANFMGNHNWARDSFPDPKRMLGNLLKKGIRVIPISETYITQKSENFAYANDHHLLTTDIDGKGKAHIFPKFWAGPAGLLDIFKPGAQQFYWSLYKQRIDEGVSGWWFDLAEPEKVTDSLEFSLGSENKVHNLYGLTWAKTAFDGWRKDFPKSRVFTLIRSGFSGMQRYSTFPWSGDISRTYEGLQAQIPIIVNMGLGGVGYMHSDGGGFTGARTKDPELYSRWLEFAAFTPVMRTHAGVRGNNAYVPEPIFWDDTTRQRVTKYIALRYRLLPYNYTMAYQNTISGRPLVMPVNYFDGNNRRLSDVNDEYLWGGHILVSPVMVKGQTQKKVLFPAGAWIGFNDHKIYRDSATVAAPLDSLPLFVKGGSVIPMLAPISNTAQYTGKKLILKYYAADGAKNVKSEWFYDNGADPNSLATKKYELVAFITTSTGNKHQVTISPVHVNGNMRKDFLLVMPGKHIKAVRFSAKTASTIIDADGSEKSAVKFKWNSKPMVLTIETD